MTLYFASNGSVADGLAFRSADLLHALLGLRQQRLAALLQGFAALVDRDQFLKRNVAALKLGDNALKLLQRRLEGERVHVGQVFRQIPSP